ncbi:MAG TPA: PTS sugar transporter subunit IIA [Puia sp.]|nr:PTS sugar transporter subunit IIA [Puia sp.]
MTKKPDARKYLIATHGALAGGVQSAVEMIIGAAENLYLIQAYMDGSKQIGDELKVVLEKVQPGEELIVFTDLLGGSVNNQVLNQALRKNVHVVSGFSLPLVIEIMMGDPGTPIQQIINEAVDRARSQMVYVNPLIAQPNVNEND